MLLLKDLKKTGKFQIKCYDLEKTEPEVVLKDLENACCLLVGSPTINKDAPLPIWQFLSLLSPVIHQNLIASAFGSYGWSGEAVHNIEKRLGMLRMKVLPGLRVRLKPGEEKLKQGEDFGQMVARAVLERREADIKNVFLPVNCNTNKHRIARMRKYQNNDIIVYWFPNKCIHDTNCFVNLPQVFDPEKRPWVNLNGADPVDIMRNIDNCPSGALQYSIPESSSISAEFEGGAGLRRDYRKRD